MVFPGEYGECVIVSDNCLFQIAGRIFISKLLVDIAKTHLQMRPFLRMLFSVKYHQRIVIGLDCALEILRARVLPFSKGVTEFLLGLRPMFSFPRRRA
jgi:hypothetical protein